MGYPIMSHLYFVFISLFILLLHFSANKGVSGGFSVELIRINSSNALSQLLMNTVQSPTNAYLGQYLMELSIGTPPVKIYGIADTGSDLLWTQCVPCNNCYKQLNPLFDPQKSSTYSNISCESEECHKLDTGICSPQNQCNYTYGYADSSITEGVLAQETITLTSSLGHPVSLKGIIFGCGHNDTGTFNDHEMGIIGLGGGPVSLISQIGSSFGGKKFSQCLVPFHTDISISSKISFGDGSEVYGDDVVSTPLVTKEYETPYLVTLQGISVGNKFVPFSSSQQLSKGNIIIDSGTPPTYLPQELYDGLVEELKAQIRQTPIGNDPSLGTQLCYRSDTNLEGPILTAHFEGADVQLMPIQTFIPPKDGVFCFAMVGATDGQYIFGNFAQSNILIGFDLDRKMVSFKPTDCTK